ncbi:hypothetical protein [Metabacillus schmidteae]|uniref:hypothetical protein n=1 Tax=Metabacillus schmidteae TaxID=2730405 RepID=UPI00158E57E3|nr:hypothetical protein [Metabacillus schmidteae]
MNNHLKKIADQYSHERSGVGSIKEKVSQLYNNYIKGKEKLITDIVTSSIALESIINLNCINHNEINPQMEEAFNLSYPNLELADLDQYSNLELEGIMNAWKGKYFEVQVRDELNQGEWIGDVHLEVGQEAVLAESPVQPGWDLQILNADGTVDEVLQLKATESLSYIKSAISEYPDIQIMATNEVLENADAITEQILPSGINNSDLEADLLEPFSTSLIDTLLPGLPFAIIALGEGHKVLVGKKDLNLALNDTLERSIKSGIAIGAGSVVYALDGGLLSIPTTILTRAGIDRFQLMKGISNRVIGKKEKIIELKDYYIYP